MHLDLRTTENHSEHHNRQLEKALENGGQPLADWHTKMPRAHCKLIQESQEVQKPV